MDKREAMEIAAKEGFLELYKQGIRDERKRVLEINRRYINCLIEALNNTEEHLILHDELAKVRAMEVQIRKQMEKEILM